MRIQYASDLHLEYAENREFIKKNPLQPEADILILAGDIIPWVQVAEVPWFFEWLDLNWKDVFWLPGNHEYYGYDLSILDDSGRYDSMIGDHILQINNQVQIRGITRFIFSTLWSKITPLNEVLIHEKLSDFREIRNGSEHFNVAEYNRLHEQCRNSLNALFHVKFEGKTVVVTHHLPTLTNYPERYKNNPLNEIFATELIELILEHQPDAWIFGHHHHNIPEFSIGKTRMLTNQLGRVNEREGVDGFSVSKVLSI